ncbi:MAG: hypothetical protein RMJ56_18175 [Gemmataceae bacterium]|nr:hypothetical protein [Gemmata sp.]MDW8199524.1 hypothetical protein [Gemmataceae bacterium]
MSYTLRDLPLPVKVVASVFLLAVGLGYSSAMVQLHMQDAKSGQPMPTVDDVIRKYTGKVKYDPNNPPPAPMSRLEALISSPLIEISSASMAGAFFAQSRAERERNPIPEDVFRAQRTGEQTAIQLWINTPEDQRQAAYNADRFIPPPGKMPAAITPEFLAGEAIKVKSILDKRCGSCHSHGGEKENIPLDTYEGFRPYLVVEAAAPVAGYVKVEEPISITKLTQSTHAHLLSWAVLFSLTGLIFAFSSYPTVVRCILGPWVVIAVFADTSLWWAARLSDAWGPYFAMGIIGTGAAAGLGLAAQIVLSLFNMYRTTGKIVLAALFALGAGIAGWLWTSTIQPALAEKQRAAQLTKVNPRPTEHPPKDPTQPQTDPNNNRPKPEPKAYQPLNDLDRLLTLPVRDDNGQPLPPDQIQFNGGPKGSMVAAFFEKDKDYKKWMDDPTIPQETKAQRQAERDAELAALQAWVRSPEAIRKPAYEANSFPVPESLAARLTSEFIHNGKVRIKSLIDARCGTCHAPEKKQEDYPLTTYEELSLYLKPLAPQPPAPNPAPPPPVPPAQDDN